MTAANQQIAGLPDMKVSVRQVFGLDVDLDVPAYSQTDEHVPDLDPDYVFDYDTPISLPRTNHASGRSGATEKQ